MSMHGGQQYRMGKFNMCLLDNIHKKAPYANMTCLRGIRNCTLFVQWVYASDLRNASYNVYNFMTAILIYPLKLKTWDNLKIKEVINVSMLITDHGSEFTKGSIWSIKRLSYQDIHHLKLWS